MEETIAHFRAEPVSHRVADYCRNNDDHHEDAHIEKSSRREKSRRKEERVTWKENTEEEPAFSENDERETEIAPRLYNGDRVELYAR